MKGFDETSSTRTESTATIERSKDGVYMFHPEPKHMLNSCLKNNPLSGMTLSVFLEMTWKNKKSIQWKRYWHRLLALFSMSIFNSFLSAIELIYIYGYLFIFRKSILANAHNQNQKDPVFVLGHPRTGTTLLHGLLALDKERFAICDTFMVGFPQCFLWFEKVGKFLFKNILSETRPMDNMKLHFDLPQEDELGTNLLSGLGVSPYSSLVFMKEEKKYRQYQTMKDVSDKDLDRWVRSFSYFIWKIRIRDLLQNKARNTPKQLVLKSPCHTGRVRLLLKLFPNAKFVFIHRNPYEVFLSGAHLASTTYGWMFLQSPTDQELQEYILKQGEILYNEYIDCRKDTSLLHEGNCVEIGFEQLTKNPFENMKEIYSRFGFDSFEKAAKSSYPITLRNEVQELKGYKRNKFSHVQLDDRLKREIQARWNNQFETFGYDKKYVTSF
jgi:hypothetical protein